MRDQKKDVQAPERRDFLRLAGLGAVVSVTAAATASSEAEAAVDMKTGGSGYRETAHVKRVYELSRF